MKDSGRSKTPNTPATREAARMRARARALTANERISIQRDALRAAVLAIHRRNDEPRLRWADESCLNAAEILALVEGLQDELYPWQTTPEDPKP